MSAPLTLLPLVSDGLEKIAITQQAAVYSESHLTQAPLQGRPSASGRTRWMFLF